MQAYSQQSTKKRLELIQKTNAENGGSLLGSFICWSIARDQYFDPKELVNAANLYQIPGELLPPELKLSSAFIKAIRKTQNAVKKDSLLLRYITRNSPKYLVGLVEENKNATEAQLQYQNLGTISFENDLVTYNLPYSPEVKAAFGSYYDHYQTYNREDVLQILASFARRYGISMLPRGGTYFISKTDDELKNRIIALVESLHPHNKVMSFEIYDSVKNQSDLTSLVENTIDVEIDKLAEELDEFMMSADPQSKTYSKGLNSRQENVILLEQKVKSMSNILQIKSQNLQNKLMTLHTAINTRDIDIIKPQQMNTIEYLKEIEEVGF